MLHLLNHKNFVTVLIKTHFSDKLAQNKQSCFFKKKKQSITNIIKISKIFNLVTLKRKKKVKLKEEG